MKSTNTKATEELKKLKDAEKNVKKSRENAMLELEKTMKTSQKKAATIKTELSKLQNKRDTLQLEVEVLQKDLVNQKVQLSITLAGLTRYEKEIDALNVQVNHTYNSLHFLLIFLLSIIRFLICFEFKL